MQTFETIVNIPLYELGDRLTEEQHDKYQAEHVSIQLELTHEIVERDPEVGVFSDYLQYKSFRALKNYPKEIMDAIDAFLVSDDSREYHDVAFQRYCDYIDYLRYYFN